MAGERAQADEMYAQLSELLEASNFPAHDRLAAKLLKYSQQIYYPRGIARALNGLGNGASHRGDADEAERYYTEALAEFRREGDRLGEGIVLNNLGTAHLFVRMDTAQAWQCYQEAIAIFEQLDQPRRVALTTLNLAEISRMEADYTNAQKYAQASLDYFKKTGETQRVGYHQVHVAYYLLMRRKYRDALKLLREAFPLLAPHNNRDFVSRYFEACFILACELKEYVNAAKLLGFLENYRVETDTPRLAFLMPWFAPQMEKIATVFTYEQLTALKDEGARLKLEEAAELAAGLKA